jgi:5-hydroxyisourate hydrolase
MASGMTAVSTHVLDTARGLPARDVPVVLERQESPDVWKVVGSARTGADGRCTQMIAQGEELSPGTYRLGFDTGSYFSALGVRGLYPIVQVTFAVREAETHYHIPLLLSPNAYTTYRGS